MSSESVATVYAQALLEVAADRGVLDALLEEVEAVATILRDEPEFRLFVESPQIEPATKQDVLRRSLEGRVSDTLLDFLLLTVQKGRQLFLGEILETFVHLHDRRVGRVRAEVVSAVEMSPDSVDALASAMGASLDRQVTLTTRVDPEILGGLVVRFDGKVADGSLKTALHEVGARMAASKFGSQFVHED